MMAARVQRAIVTAILLIVCINQASQAAQKITKEQAVKIAEQFIVDNGYTAKPCIRLCLLERMKGCCHRPSSGSVRISLELFHRAE